MRDVIFERQFRRAMEEGRKCSRCGWMITVPNWKKGARMCANCIDALKGVNVDGGHWKPLEEPVDMTGETR